MWSNLAWGAPSVPSRIPVLQFSDRCDRGTCSARALVITLHSGRPLYWCAHHYAQVEAHVARLKVVDQRHTLRDRSTPVSPRSEEHPSELQSLMRISYAVFCLKKKKKHNERKTGNEHRTT